MEYQWTQYWESVHAGVIPMWVVRSCAGYWLWLGRFAHLRVRVWGVFGFLGAPESGVRVLCGLYGLACCWVFGGDKPPCPVGWVLVGFSALCGGLAGAWPVGGGVLGVLPVFAAGALVWWRFRAVAGVRLRGCGVVVWELYSEREHLADEMSWRPFPWILGCLSLRLRDFVRLFYCSILKKKSSIWCRSFLRAHGGCLGIKSR